MESRPIRSNEERSIETLDFVSVESAYIKVLIARISLVYIILMACAATVPLIADVSCWRIIIIAESVLAAAFALNTVLVHKIYRVRGYALRDRDISYRKGLFFTSVTTIPFCKIQQVSIRMNPLSRIFGLYYLDVINGSQSVANLISIPGLSRDKAERIKLLLIDKADSADD